MRSFDSHETTALSQEADCRIRQAKGRAGCERQEDVSKDDVEGKTGKLRHAVVARHVQDLLFPGKEVA